MPLLQRRQSPPPIEDETTMFPETVLLETSYDEELGSKQTEVSKLPFSHSQFPLQQGGGMISAPPLLDELNSDSDSSFESSSSLDFYSKIHHFPLEQNVEVCVDNGDCFYTDIMQSHSEKHVRFSTVEIRHYPLIVGNHPNCNATGLPLELDWKYTHSTSIDLTTTTTTNQEEPPKAQRLTLLQRMKRLKGFYKTQELWLEERHRRQALEQEELQLYSNKKHGNLCGECNEDEHDVELLSFGERQAVMKYTTTVVCHAMQCLVSDE